jgi:hypothetical protein
MLAAYPAITTYRFWMTRVLQATQGTAGSIVFGVYRRHSIIYRLMYDPFVPGRFTVVERNMEAFDAARNRSFPCDVWSPAEPVGV